MDADHTLYFLTDLLERIRDSYPSVAGPDDCPKRPHGCDKCEIYFCLNAFKEWQEEEAERLSTNG